MPESRYIFIPELRERIASDLVTTGLISRDDAIEVIQRWEDGEEVRSVMEEAVFAACAKVKDDLEGMRKAEVHK